MSLPFIYLFIFCGFTFRLTFLFVSLTRPLLIYGAQFWKLTLNNLEFTEGEGTDNSNL